MTGWKPEHTASLIAAIIVGGSILTGSWWIRSSLDEATAGIDGVRAGLAETKQALQETTANAKQEAPKQRRRGPDPDQRYTINTSGSPAQGPASAKVVIAEFSDFQ